MHFDHSLLVSKQNKHHLQSVSAESHSLNCSRCVHHLCQENVHRIHVKTPCAPFLCKPSIISPWHSSITVSEDGGDALSTVFLLLLRDNNSSHDEKKKCNFLTCALSVNRRWHFKPWPSGARLSAHLPHLRARAHLSGKRCSSQAGEQRGGRTKRCPKPPLQFHAGGCN